MASSALCAGLAWLSTQVLQDTLELGAVGRATPHGVRPNLTPQPSILQYPVLGLTLVPGTEPWGS